MYGLGMKVARSPCLSATCLTTYLRMMVASTTLAQAPVRALHRAVLERGAWPLLRLAPPGIAEDFYRYGAEAHLDGFAPLELIEMQEIDAIVRVAGVP